jgi:hypothetical protein
MSKARNLSDFISDPTISTTEIADLAVTHAKLHGTMDLSSKTVTLPSAITDTITNKLPLAGGTLTGLTTVNMGAETSPLRVGSTGNDAAVSYSNASTPTAYNVRAGMSDTDDFSIWTSDTKRLTVKDNGNVGIGETSPDARFHIKNSLASTGVGTSSAAIVVIQNERLNTGSSSSVLRFDTNEITGTNQYSRAAIGAEYDGASNVNGRLMFSTADSSGNLQERMRIDASGNVLFGGITDKNVFNDTSGTGASINNDAGEMQIKNASDTCLYLNRTGSNGTIVSLRKDGTQIGIIGVADASAKMSIIGTNENLQIGANGANVFNVSTNSVYPQTDNTVDVGFSASGNRFKDLHLSGAINQKNNTKIECINSQSNVGDLVFSTRYSTLGEKVRITGLGYLLVGKANASLASSNTGVVLNRNGVSSINSGSDTNMIFARAGTGTMIVFRANNVTTAGTISVSASSTAYNTSSDYRLKENVVDLTGASARVNQLNPSRFNWIADETNTLVDGFLAHEVADVVPEAITGAKDAMRDEEYEVTPAVLDDDGNVTTEAVMGTRSVPDYQGIDQSKLVPLLTAALQEALTEIASLKTRVEALEA